MKITLDRWQAAQIAERKQHIYEFDYGVKHYKRSYENYAKYIHLARVDGTVIEIGPADYPALQHYPAKRMIVIEPMPSDYLKKIANMCGMYILPTPMEQLDFCPESDECWIMNVLQHVIDPDLFIEKCKASAKIIRYFEPLYTDVCEYHPHTFIKEDFIRWFGKTNIYNDSLPGFHTATCAYGVWEKPTDEDKK